MKRKRIIVEVIGGAVQEIYCQQDQGGEIEVLAVDWDNKATGAFIGLRYPLETEIPGDVISQMEHYEKDWLMRTQRRLLPDYGRPWQPAIEPFEPDQSIAQALQPQSRQKPLEGQTSLFTKSHRAGKRRKGESSDQQTLF